MPVYERLLGFERYSQRLKGWRRPRQNLVASTCLLVKEIRRPGIRYHGKHTRRVDVTVAFVPLQSLSSTKLSITRESRHERSTDDPTLNPEAQRVSKSGMRLWTRFCKVLTPILRLRSSRMPVGGQFQISKNCLPAGMR
jgi:hypothetical protein